MGDTVKKVAPIAAGVIGAGLLGPGGFTLANMASGAALGSAVGGAFGGTPGASAPPPTQAPTAAAPSVMPTPDDEAMRLAKRRSMMQQFQRRGRSSTILTGDSETLG